MGFGRGIMGYFAKKKKRKIHCLCLNPHSVNIRVKVLTVFWLIFLPIVGLCRICFSEYMGHPIKLVPF